MEILLLFFYSIDRCTIRKRRKVLFPLGRGINFSIESSNIEQLYQRVLDNHVKLYREMKSSVYMAGENVIEQKEFLVQDPDGYLLRFTKQSSKE